MMLRTAALSLVLLPTLLWAQGSVPYATQQSWESYPSGVTTGGAFADIDNDGHLDLVVANGNDILRQRVEVYYGDGTGSYPVTPQWQSADIDYHGHLSIGDVNSDGWMDVAVSVFLGPSGFSSPGRVKLYLNNGSGTLGTLPTWSSADSFYSFSCRLGDADGDGDLDLAVAVGEVYSHPPGQNRIYYNQGGSLNTLPGWLSTPIDHAFDVSWEDVDGDGDLDLAFCIASGPNRVYLQGPGGIPTSPNWSSQDNPNQNGNSLAFADVDQDGHLELAVSDNNQLSGGAGVFKIYDNIGGTLATTPFFTTPAGYSSAVAFGDLHLDGYPDLFGGIWWGGTKAYLNDSGSFSASSNWSSQSSSVVEALFFGDVNEDGLRSANSENHPGNGVRKTFYLQHAPAHSLLAVRADGQILPPNAYCYDLESGWIALAQAPAVDLGVDYVYSESLDLGVTNWDGSRGNYVFLREPLVEVSMGNPSSTSLYQGDTLHFNVTLSSTTNRVEAPLYHLVVFLPFGIYGYLDLHTESLAPFGTQSLSHSIPIPFGLPPSWFGTYLMAAGTTEAGLVTDYDFFSFALNP